MLAKSEARQGTTQGAKESSSPLRALYPYKGVDRMLESLPPSYGLSPTSSTSLSAPGPTSSGCRSWRPAWACRPRSALGPVALAKIVELYNVADIFVMLSREEPPDVEGFGLVFLEAAACGLPSLGGRSGGIPDAIDEGRSGWLVDPCDTQEIAAITIELLKSPERLSALRSFAYRRPQKNLGAGCR